MTPYYVRHKAGEHGGKKRAKDSFVTYYVCAQQMKGWKKADHKNLILARRSEEWVLERIRDLATTDALVEQAVENAYANALGQLQPERDLLNLTRKALQENQNQSDQLVASVSGGVVTGALLSLLNEKATALKMEREGLQIQHKQAMQSLSPLEKQIDPQALRRRMKDFSNLVKVAEPVEVQRLLRLMVRRIEWVPDGAHRVELYAVRQGRRREARASKDDGDGPIEWLQTNVSFGGAEGIRTPDLLSAIQARYQLRYSPVFQREMRVGLPVLRSNQDVILTYFGDNVKPL